MCAKKNALTPQEVETIINDYLRALKLVKGELVMQRTDLSYRKGFSISARRAFPQMP